jgi:hypothetical protein
MGVGFQRQDAATEDRLTDDLRGVGGQAVFLLYRRRWY